MSSRRRNRKENGRQQWHKNNEHSPQGLLALVLNNSEVLVLSPYSDTPLHRITELKEVYLVAGSPYRPTKDLLAYGHSQLSLVDPARNTQTAKIQTGSPICDIKQANTYLYVASQGSSIINVYDLNNSSEQVATLECAGEVTKLNKLDDDQIVAFTANCTQVFTKPSS
ncbi:hypothetical protein CJJ09_005297 [Candidozyma auris]|nr:hypothetical protein CJJ09_005297 [[Candida] auris]